MNCRVAAIVALFSLFLTPLAAEAAFHSRLGGQAYYDDQLDITWAADANLIGFNTWDNQVVALTTLTIDGVSGWRLPDMDVDNDGTVVECTSGLGQAGCKDNEYAHMYRYGAGTTWGGGIRFGLPGPFSNIVAFSYWSSTTVPVDDAWSLAMSNGSQEHYWQENIFGAWAVHNGDVGALSLTGDLNADGFVGIADLNIILGNWNQSIPPGDPLADPSGDNFVGIADLNIVLGNWNAGIPSAESFIPEPGVATLLLIGSIAFLDRKHQCI